MLGRRCDRQTVDRYSPRMPINLPLLAPIPPPPPSFLLYSFIYLFHLLMGGKSSLAFTTDPLVRPLDPFARTSPAPRSCFADRL